MAASASQLCVRQASTLLDCFIHHKGCKVEQISPLFHLYLYLFFKFRRASVLFYALFYANLACQVLYLTGIANCVQLVTLVMNYIFCSIATNFTNHDRVFLTICIKNFLIQNSLMIPENLYSCQKTKIKP